jgi:hypothetical protein
MISIIRLKIKKAGVFTPTFLRADCVLKEKRSEEEEGKREKERGK